MKKFNLRPSQLRGILLLSLLLRPEAARAAGANAATPAQMQIDAARSALERQPTSVKNFNSLAVGLTRRARETGDVAYYQEAVKTLQEAERLDPGNRQSLRISAWVAMGQHEFLHAYTVARRYDRRYPDDSWNLSVMGDALMELGRYDEAEKTFQKMVDLRPGPAAYSRVAYLREIRGDLDGAMQMMQMALSASDPRETEDRAWLLVQIAHLQELNGNLAASEASYRAALQAFAGYHYALAGLSELMLRQGHAQEAASLASSAIESAPHAERYLVLADALRASGREPEALEAEATFEQLALKNVENSDNENHDLVLFYLQRRPDAGKALGIARLEAGRRRDIHTLDRLAVALAAAGETRQAKHLLRQVLKIGTRDPLIAGHAASLGMTLTR